MNAQKIKDIAFRNKLAGIYYPEAGVIEIKLFGCRLLRIQFPPNTPIKISFCDSNRPVSSVYSPSLASGS